MSNIWVRLILTTALISGTFGAANAQTGPLPPLAPLSPGQATTPPVIAATPAAGASSDSTNAQLLYNGGAVGDKGIGIGAWGGGMASQDDAHSLNAGEHSLLIESPGFYQGGTITFAQPIDLGDMTDKSKYLQISIMVSADPKYPSAAPAPDPNNPAPPQNSSFTGSSESLFKLAQMNPSQMGPPMPGGFPGPGMTPPGTPAPPDQDDQAPPQLPAKLIRFVFSFADGTSTDISRVLPTPDEPQDWFNVGVPLCKLMMSPNTTQPKLVSLTLSTDSPALVNVARVKLLTDSSPIVADAGGEKDISVNENAVFKAHASGGASMLNFQWDFDTQNDFVPQAEGPRATHTYATAGAYKVTVVVTDVDGIKAPASATTTVHVEE